MLAMSADVREHPQFYQGCLAMKIVSFNINGLRARPHQLAALIVPPLRRLGVADSWMWRLRMIIGTGLRCTRRYLDYQAALVGSLPSDQVHMLPLLGVHPDFRSQQHAEQLLQAVHDWCAEEPGSHGVVLDTGNARYLAFYKLQGYQEIGEIAIGPVTERVFFHPNPLSSRSVTAGPAR